MKFVLFSLLEMRYMLVVWRASRGSRADMQWEEARRGLGILYFRFCMCSTIYLQACLIMHLRICRWVSHRRFDVFLSNTRVSFFSFHLRHVLFLDPPNCIERCEEFSSRAFAQLRLRHDADAVADSILLLRMPAKFAWNRTELGVPSVSNPVLFIASAHIVSSRLDGSASAFPGLGRPSFGCCSA